MRRSRCRWICVLLMLGLSGCVRQPFSSAFRAPPELKDSPERLPIPPELGIQSDTAVQAQPTPPSDDQLLADGFAAPGPPPLPDLPEPERPLSDQGLEFGIIPEAQLADRAPGQKPRPLRPASEVGRDVPGLAMSSHPASSGPSLAPDAHSPEQPPPDSWPLPARIAAAWRSYYDASPAQALPQFALLAQEAPDRADIQVGLARCLIARGELDEAYRVLEQARQRATPGDPEPEFYLGLVAYQRAHFREAVSRWTGLEALLDVLPPGPLHRDHAWLLARARLELGDRAGGEAAFRRALRLGGALLDGRLSPPPLELEYLPDGRLPGGQFLPVTGRGSTVLEPPMLLGYEGRLWRLAGASPVLERLTEPPPGWQDLAPVPLPRAPAMPNALLESHPPGLIFLSRDPEGRTFLQELSPAGARILLSPEPVEPLRPAVSPDGALVAFVRTVPVGEEGQREPRLFLLRRSSRDLTPVAWPGKPVGEPAFSPLGGLVFPVEEDRLWRLVRFVPGAEVGEDLPLLPLVKPTREATTPDVRVQRIHDPARAPLPVRARVPAAPPTPMRVDEPWKSEAIPFMPEPAPTAPTAGVPSVPEVAAKASLGEGDARQPAAPRDPESRLLVYGRVVGAQRSVRLYDEAQQQELQLSAEGTDCFAPTMSASGLQVAWLCRVGTRLEPYLWHRQTGVSERIFGLPLRPGDALVFER